VRAAKPTWFKFPGCTLWYAWVHYMDGKDPFDFVPTEPAEELLYRRENPTFHRSFAYCLAASNRAAYFYVRGLRLRARWVRVPIMDITRVSVTPYSRGSAVVLIAAAALFSGVVGAHVLNGQWWPALTFGALILYFTFISLQSLRDRTEISIIKRNGIFRFRSPEDHYSAEKQYDRKFVLELTSVLEQIGINVEYRGLAPPSATALPSSRPMTRPDNR
jgi:hypothetical protein